MKRAQLHWYPTGIPSDSRRFLGDGVFDYGHVFKAGDGGWGASWDGGFDTFKTRKAAMEHVEKAVRVGIRKAKRKAKRK